jgi:hypothetical protein
LEIDGENVSNLYLPLHIENPVTFADLPNEKAITITYKALVLGSIGEEVNISNKVQILGFTSDDIEVKDVFTVTESDAAGVGSKAVFHLLKTEQGNNSHYLSGAEFALYIKDAYSGWASRELPEGVVRTIEIPTGEDSFDTYYFLIGRSTDEYGKTTFADDYITAGRNFLLVETQAPVGYEKLDEPIFIHIKADGVDQPAGVDWALNDEDEISVPNAPGVRFPETGGGGALPYTVAGAAVMALALLLAGRRFFNGSAATVMASASLLTGRRGRRHFDDSA